MVEENEKHEVPTGTRLKYTIAKSPELGRYLVAAKDLVAGEAIFREKPAAVGPAAFFEGSLCFNCLKPIVLTKLKDFHCKKCQVAPLCHPTCELVSGYHGLAECELFQANQLCIFDISEHPAAILLPLRLWLLKESNSEVWKNINHLEDHIKERRGTPVWKDRTENVVQVLQKLGLIPNDDESSNLMQRLCGILDVNSFELRSLDDSENHLLRGIYTSAALMAHDCRGNTHLTVDDKHQLTVYASVPIEKGGTIYFNYTASSLGTAERRRNLREGKYFECKCPLCRDPRELGSHLSSLICPRCHRGYVVIQNPLTVKTYALDTKWQCEHCKSLLSGKMIKTTLDLIRCLVDGYQDSDTKVEVADDCVNQITIRDSNLISVSQFHLWNALESLLQKLLLTIHSNHYFALELKHKILAGYRREISAVHPQRKILERMLNLCKELLVVLDITEPGISRLKGITLYEMHLPTALLANKSYTAREISSMELTLQLEDAEGLLQKALSNLLLEPAATPEGQLAKRALQELKLLRQNIADVRALPTAVEEPQRQFKKKIHKVK